MKINERGFWENKTPEGHGYDLGLAYALVHFFLRERAESVIDMGCGTGIYTAILRAEGFKVLGVDGNPNTPELTNGLCGVADLSKDCFLGEFDWVLSLEVGEHIPAEYEKNFLGNLDRHNRQGIVLSWAVKGQGGDGHVNCQDNEEIMLKLSDMKYELDTLDTAALRTACAKYPQTGWWFRNTLMVFRRQNESVHGGNI